MCNSPVDLVHNAHEYLLPYFSPLILFAISSAFIQSFLLYHKESGTEMNEVTFIAFLPIMQEKKSEQMF